MMNKEYIELAHRKSLLDYVSRLLMDRLVDGDAPAKERVICEEAPFREREVPQDVVLEMVEQAQQESHELQLEMNKFITTRKADVESKPKPTSFIAKKLKRGLKSRRHLEDASARTADAPADQGQQPEHAGVPSVSGRS
jgi:hypothetical protein